MLSSRSLPLLRQSRSRARLLVLGRCRTPPLSAHRRLLSSLSSAMLQDTNTDTDAEKAAKEQQEAKERIREELNNKTGRAWTDPWDLDELMQSKVEYDDLPDWSPDLVSRISQERVKICDNKIPTLEELVQLNLPSPPPAHPAVSGKAYALHRQRALYTQIRKQVQVLAEPRISAIQVLQDWHDKQDAVDELFEEIEFTLKKQETVLGKHPKFGVWVERALEDYLKSLQQSSDKTDEGEPPAVVPIFMDCYDETVDKSDEVVPTILHPLASKTDDRHSSIGKMVEEWELAAHKTSKRILLRKATQQIAQALIQEDSNKRILVSGVAGVGKSAALAATVAAARKSKWIVLFIPDGDQWHQNGFYIEPNPHKSGIYDLPVLSQQACREFSHSHAEDLADLKIPQDVLDAHFTSDQVQRLFRDLESKNELSLVALLEFGAERSTYAGSCYSAAVDFMMYHQDEKPFLLAVDEFNCLCKPQGHYFHADYDEEVKKSIPYEQISLFQPAMEAMGAVTTSLSAAAANDNPDEASPLPPLRPLKKGSILVATTESHAVPRTVTDALVDQANHGAESTLQSVVVPRFSALEVDHVLSNYEATGVGKLRLDRGETVANPQEVAYLRTVSGSVAQHLMNACML